MVNRFLLLFFIILEIAVNTVSAQVEKYRSEMITRDNGLSNSTVNCILKDKYGFLWFGTWNGLNRYDGYEMTVFLSDAKDSTTLSNGKINTLFQDSEGLLWIGTDKGLNCYDQITGKFKRYCSDIFVDKHANQITGIIQDSLGILWISCREGGLLSLDKKTASFKHYTNAFSDISNNMFSLLQDKLNSQYLWIGTANGLFRFNKITGSFDRVQGIAEASVLVYVMQQDNQGNLYLGTWGNGLIKYERKTGLLSYCLSDIAEKTTIRNSIIWSMASDDAGNIILGLRDFGLAKYYLKTGKISTWDTGDINKELNGKVVVSMYTEPSGTLWIGTIYNGIIQIVPLINSFKYYGSALNNHNEKNKGGVVTVLEDSKGYLWLGTRFGGLYRINRRTNEYKEYKQTPGSANSLSNNNILSLIEVMEGNQQVIWIGTDGGGLNRFEPKTGRFTVYKSKNGLPTGPASNYVSSVIQYDRDHLLIGTYGWNIGEGMDVFNMKTGRFVNLKYDPTDSSSPGSNIVLKLFKDKSGTIWVGTHNGGLNKFVIKNINAEKSGEVGYFVRYTNNPSDSASLNNNTVCAIHEDSQQNLWIGTSGGGLFKFDGKLKTFAAFNLHKNIADNTILGILGDNNKNLWISSNRGIIELNPTTNEVHSFDKYDGLQENTFISGSYFKSVSGEMFFGGIRGCNAFYPDSVMLNMKAPNIVITSFYISGKKGKMNVAELTGKSVIASKSVKIPYYLNDFSFAFSALDYKVPAKNGYKYKLIGYDKDWIDTDAKRRYVNYTNLPPGKYVFKVIGSNNDDIWNNEGTSVTIIITPPFWGTAGFHLLMILLVAGIISYFFYTILQRYHREKMQVELEARLSLQDERKQLRTLIDSMPDCIYIKDKESKFTIANKRVAQIMGTIPENLIGKTDYDFYAHDMAQAFYDDEQAIMRTGVPMINYEEPMLDEQGNRIISSTTKVPFRNETGEIIGIVGIGRDITRLKRIELQLRKKSEDLQETNRLLQERQEETLMQSEELAEQTQNLRMINAELESLNRTKDKFFSIIAHDLRNPFNAIIGFSELLRNDFYEIDDNQKLDLLEMINISSETAYDLLENLLQWARTQTDKIKFNPENFDITETVNSVIDLHCIIAKKKGVVLVNAIAPLTLVYADKDMINTVIRNLISNAIKFSNPEGKIVISAVRTAETVEVKIMDEGIGMNRENLGKLFRIDTYYSTSGTLGESGTGLGLIICKEFIEKNKGRIKATSIEGKGTTLSFTLDPAREN